ncbi:ABC transporter permease/substrate binding protein [Leuconostocaceae bacterium ESL0958]|nr:ABC transporter permease/substrate binding protein [Leuconostocaceae bacterium ESL0958]
MNTLFSMNPIPISDWVSDGVGWLTTNWAGFFNGIQSFMNSLMDASTNFLTTIPMAVFILVMVGLALFTARKKFGFASFVLFGLLLVANLRLWDDFMQTLTLVLLSSLIALVIGVPLGVWSAKKPKVYLLVKPLLDFMQTMPAFVYLIPAVAFFGIGVVPGVGASIVFALPPVVNLTYLAFQQVPLALEETADSFGATFWQKLFKVELPAATNTILEGCQQTIRLALSMVVMASMIGAPGLGRGVLSAVQHADVGAGFENGLALVIMAIIIDRLVGRLSRGDVTAPKLPKWQKWGALAMVAIFVLSGAVGSFQAAKESGKKVSLGYVQWDTEVASTNVLAEAMRQHGYQVSMTPLDNAVNWQSVANGQVDASTAAWLPLTHQEMYKKYKDQIQVAGTSVTGVKTGLVVPDYMPVNSIADLTDQANKTITGIEPGAGEMKQAKKTLSDYSNLSGWQLQEASTGAMTASLGKAIQNHQPIIVTGWSPHWIFQKYHLKYLQDPKGTMGSGEHIDTITRKNLKSAKPDVYKVMQKFKWTKQDMEGVMLKMQEGQSPKEAADDWIKAHPKEVAAWFK